MAAPSEATTALCLTDEDLGTVFGIFTFKGGAAKSTTAVNVAGAMSAKGLKVLMIDFDQQCNLTQFFNTDEWKHVDTEHLRECAKATGAAAVLREMSQTEVPPEPSFDDWEDKLYPDPLPTDMSTYVSRFDDQKNINSVFRPVFKGTNVDEALAVLKHGEDGRPHERTGIHRVNPEAFRGEPARGRPSKQAKEFTGNDFAGELWLFPGSPELGEHESEMGRQLQNLPNRATGEEASTKGAGLCAAILRELRKHYDVIIVDMSPSSGALNQAMTMSCDYIIPPGFGSVYSMGSTHKLFTSVFPAWYDWRKQVVENHALEDVPDQFRLKPTPPKILPVLITNYELLAEKSEGRWVMGFEHSNFVHTLHSFMEQLCRGEFYPAKDKAKGSHKNIGMKEMLDNFRPRGDGQMVTAVVAHQPAVISVSEELGRTIAELTPELYKTEYGTVTQEEYNRTRGRTVSTAFSKLVTKDDLEDFAMRLNYMQERYRKIADWLLWVPNARPASTSAFVRSNGKRKRGD